ncbi:MAG: pH regulation protein AB [Marinilabiliales bacterium]|nr:MAG: pH regulation protein AB [Marinilabiliales bacterium]
MAAILLLLLIIAFSNFIIPRGANRFRGIILAVFQLVAFVFFYQKLAVTNAGEVITESYRWIPELGLNLQFQLDGVSIIFALLVTGIGVLVFLYAQAYMKPYGHLQRFFFFLFLFSFAMLGLVLSANMIQLFIFWELTSFLSFFLITYFNEKEEARAAAFRSLFITAFGGLSLLAGILLIGNIAGSYVISDWVASAAAIKAHSHYLPGLLLILLGVFTKSAQFPFHFWLPGAMQAPTPVSSYLHSATMVKAGVFLLMRLSPVMGNTPEWNYIISLVGVTTMLIGGYFALTQRDLKGVLAYTTISALGILVLMLGIDTKLSVKSAIVFLLVHAFYKATLFMVAGFIDKKTGTRDLTKLGGLARQMPVTMVITMLALLSMAGLPPMLGFIGKELIYEAKVQLPGIASIILVVGVLANAFMVAVSVFLGYKLFFGKQGDLPKKPDEKGVLYLLGPAVLVLLSLIYGLFPGIINRMVEVALQVVVPKALDIHLKLWHGFNQVLLLSVFTVLIGSALAFFVIKKPKLLGKWSNLNSSVFSFSFTKAFSNMISGFVGFSERNTARIQHGSHRYYILTIFVVTSLMLWYQLYDTRGWTLATNITLQPFYISILVAISIAAAVFTMFSKSRLSSIIAMGVVGYGLSLIFLYYSAVDLAITQILAETLILVMFVLILQKLPVFAKLSSRATKIRDMIIALSFGGVMTTLALKAINVEFNHPISDFFLENSYTKAYGENVVNVILVDFRALDTMGEVTVLTIAALGVFVLLKTRSKKI